jgi:protein-S-isoprenylcysteine O-methyltransferase
VLLLVLVPTAAPFGVYLLLLSTFHLNEYLLTAAFRPDTLNFDNFLLNHSRLYQTMILLSWLEYWLERLLAPGVKQWGLISSAGLCLSVLGLATRGIAMATASSNFSHLIEEVCATRGQAALRAAPSTARHGPKLERGFSPCDCPPLALRSHATQQPSPAKPER